MATLGKPYPLPQYTSNWEESYLKQEEALRKIPMEKLYLTPVADGYAHYYIESLTPLVLRHIPFGDAWQANPALIRGLRKQDILADIERRKAWKNLLKKRGQNETPN